MDRLETAEGEDSTYAAVSLRPAFLGEVRGRR